MENIKFYFLLPKLKIAISQWSLEGLQIYNSKFLAEEALRKRKKLTKILEEKRAKSMQGNKRALGNSGGDQSNLVQFSSEVQKLKNAKIKRAKELLKKGIQSLKF